MIFSFFGGKKTASSWIYSQITDDIKQNTKIFTEVFSGAFWVYFNHDFEFADKVIYNDKNVFLTNFFASCTKPEFIEKLKYELTNPNGTLYFDDTQFSTPEEAFNFYYDKFRTYFYKLREELMTNNLDKEIKIDIPDIELAFKYAVFLRHAYSGLSRETACYSYSSTSPYKGKPCPKPKSQHLIKLYKNPEMSNKLLKVSAFESLDFEEHIKKYDSPETLFYVDPPYFSCEKHYYRGEKHFGTEGHRRLAEALKNIQGKFMLSYYDFDGLSELYPKDKYRWEEKSFTKASSNISNPDKHISEKQGVELLIMNF